MPTQDTSSRTAARILRLSRVNGWSVTLIAAVFGLLSLASLAWAGVWVGAGVTCSGLMEIHGHRRLARRVPGARRWMAGSQAVLVACVLAYCAWRLAVFDPEDPLAMLGEAKLLRGLITASALPLEMVEELVRTVTVLTYRLVAVLTLVLQGGLGIVYWIKVGQLEAAATDPAQ